MHIEAKHTQTDRQTEHIFQFKMLETHKIILKSKTKKL